MAAIPMPSLWEFEGEPWNAPGCKFNGRRYYKSIRRKSDGLEIKTGGWVILRCPRWYHEPSFQLMGREEDGTFIYVCYIRAFTVDDDGDAASLMVLWLHPDPAAPGVRWLHCAEDPGWKNSSGQDVLADWIQGPVYVRAFGAPLFEPGASLSWCIHSEADLVCVADFASPLPDEAVSFPGKRVKY